MISVLDINEYSKLSELAESVDLAEVVDFKCVFLVAKDDEGRIIGVAGTRFDYSIPRFEHIIVRKEYQKTSLAFRLMKQMEKYIMEKGFKTYVALIPNTNKIMRGYANKFGFVEYDKVRDSTWFYKQLQGDL